jgi:hypothetical protein
MCLRSYRYNIHRHLMDVVEIWSLGGISRQVKEINKCLFDYAKPSACGFYSYLTFLSFSSSRSFRLYNFNQRWVSLIIMTITDDSELEGIKQSSVTDKKRGVKHQQDADSVQILRRRGNDELLKLIAGLDYTIHHLIALITSRNPQCNLSLYPCWGTHSRYLSEYPQRVQKRVQPFTCANQNVPAN